MSRWSAPGKLFLFGEYAVLGGAWCLVAAVDHRVYAEERPGEAYTLEGAEASNDLPQRVLDAAGSPLDVRALHGDVREFFEGERKLGLGSSAASCVAMAALALGDASDADRVFEVAGTAHREFQRGRGSHADIAASTYGGLIAYRLHEAVPPFPRLGAEAVDGTSQIAFAHLGRVPWPKKYRARAYWLGEPASSTELIGRVEPAISAGEPAALEALEAISTSAQQAIEALRTDADLLPIVLRAHHAMRSLGAATGAPIVTEPAEELFQTAEGFDVAGKMSGAGGGDFAMLVGARDSNWAAIEARHPGLWLDLEFNVAGVAKVE